VAEWFEQRWRNICNSGGLFGNNSGGMVVTAVADCLETEQWRNVCEQQWRNGCNSSGGLFGNSSGDVCEQQWRNGNSSGGMVVNRAVAEYL